MGPTQPPVQYVQGGCLSPGINGQEVKAITHTTTYNAEVKNEWNYIYSHPRVFMADTVTTLGLTYVYNEGKSFKRSPQHLHYSICHIATHDVFRPSYSDL